MKIKKLIDLKNECDNKIECLCLALEYAEPWGIAQKETTRITLSPEQAEDIKRLLAGYKKLLNTIINNAEVGI